MNNIEESQNKLMEGILAEKEIASLAKFLKCEPKNVAKKIKELLDDANALQKLIDEHIKENPPKLKTCVDCGKNTNENDGEAFNDNWVCQSCANGRWYHTVACPI